MTRISASVLFTPYSKLYILTELSADDVKFISSDRQEIYLSKYYSYGIVNSILVEIQPNSTNIKNDPRIHFFVKYYEGCSNMNASSFITFFTYMLRQNVIPFWKELYVAFKKMTPTIKLHSLYFSSYRPLYKGHSCTLKFSEENTMHVLVHVRI